jgi:hypothetical protein
MYSAVPKKVMHIFWKANSYSWNTILCLLVHCWLGNLRIQSFQGQTKEELQVAVGLLRGYVVYQISNNCILLCVSVCVCVCARMCVLTKEHICSSNSCVLIYPLCQIWCILSIQNKSVKIHDDHVMIIFVIFIYFKIKITCQIKLFVTITHTHTHTHVHQL